MKKRNIKRFVKQATESNGRGCEEEKRKEGLERKNEKRVSECITLIGVRGQVQWRKKFQERQSLPRFRFTQA